MPVYVVLAVGIELSTIENKPSFLILLISEHDLKVKRLAVKHLELQYDAWLDEAEVSFTLRSCPSTFLVCYKYVALARLVVCFFKRALDAPGVYATLLSHAEQTNSFTVSVLIP